ncbi:MAG: hypothetical protein HYU25_06430 [Candidatus Rokubacteria bacterium]|nr:hypothetical protein [Candidatus Rokubacteria bacterium]
MSRHLFIIARDESDLCAYLRREFSGEENVVVFLDRRKGGDRRSGRDRRSAPRTSGTQDRRRAERRVRKFVDTQLRSTGYAMLQIS